MDNRKSTSRNAGKRAYELTPEEIQFLKESRTLGVRLTSGLIAVLQVLDDYETEIYEDLESVYELASFWAPHEKEMRPEHFDSLCTVYKLLKALRSFDQERLQHLQLEN